MNTETVICPLCGAINKDLYLEETAGWMECDACGAVIQVVNRDENDHSVCSPDQCNILLPLTRK